jgi:hypothetical protein
MADQAREDASGSEAIARLSEEAEVLKAQKAELEAKIRVLRDSEDFEAGVYHAGEIFELQQNKLRLETELEFIRKKINRIRLAEDPTGLLH